MPHDEGFVGRECNNQDCKRYFKIFYESISDYLYCPYCAQKYQKNDLMTGEQVEYLKRVTKENALELVHSEFQKAFKRSFSGSKSLTYKPGRPYRAKQVQPHYQEKKLDTQLECPLCNCTFQVDGIFGYCPGCKTENIAIYDANLALIKKEIENDTDNNRALRHAYSDLVSTFELFCKKKSKLLTDNITRFQMLFEARSFFKKLITIDILEELSIDELLNLRRVFQKRHAYEHNTGIIDERYVKEIPEDKGLLGTKAELTIKEFESAAQALRKAIDKLLIGVEKSK
jgi:Zn finger protein HypA/HybF involved in hydrogenase expression